MPKSVCKGYYFSHYIKLHEVAHSPESGYRMHHSLFEKLRSQLDQIVNGTILSSQKLSVKFSVSNSMTSRAYTPVQGYLHPNLGMVASYTNI